jgi:hypothetical protein
MSARQAASTFWPAIPSATIPPRAVTAEAAVPAKRFSARMTAAPAEGAPSETYLDDDNRLMFHNAQDYYARYGEDAAMPGLYCAPRLEDGYEVEAVRQRIARRAGLPRNADSKRPYVKVYRRPRVATAD